MIFKKAIKEDFHMHTNFCDGKDSIEDMILSAIDKGLERVGICCHSHTEFLTSYCIAKEGEQKFIDEVNRLKEKYADRIEVLCGIEQDYWSEKSDKKYDYVIGSLHFVKKQDEYYGLDFSKEMFVEIVQKLYNGDYYSLAEEYFDKLSNIVEKTNADIIGHIDLITKFNEGYNLFDEEHPRYVSAYKKAIDKLITYNIPFEINSGAISRGHRKSPYPSKQIIEYIKAKGGKLILSSDSHSKENVAFQYDKWQSLL